MPVVKVDNGNGAYRGRTGRPPAWKSGEQSNDVETHPSCRLSSATRWLRAQYVRQCAPFQTVLERI